MAGRRPRLQAVPVDAGALRPDGIALGAAGLLAYAFGDSRVRVWDTHRAVLHHELHGHRGAVTAVAADASGQLLATSSVDGTVRVTELATATSVHVLELPDGTAGEPVRSVAFTPRGAVVGLAGAVVCRWDPGSGAVVDLLPGSTDLLRVGVTVGGHVVALAAAGALLWHAHGSGPALPLVVPPTGPLWPVTAADGSWAAIAGARSEMRDLGDDRVLSGRPGARMQRRPTDLAVLTRDRTLASVYTSRHDPDHELPHIGVLAWEPPRHGDPDARGYLRGLDPAVVARVVGAVTDGTGTVVAATASGDLIVVDPAGESLQRWPPRKKVARVHHAPGSYPPHRVVDTGPSIDPRVFWNVVETARTRAEHDLPGADLDEQAERQIDLLVDLLAERSSEEIRGFDQFFADRMDESFRWDLWAVATIIGGGCSDDTFEYFRSWLIGQGEEYYARALSTPAEAARRIPPGTEIPGAWGLRGAADEVHERLHGGPVPDLDRPPRGEPTGPTWTIPAELFPELAARYDPRDG